jgi:hypothetical protein
MAIMAIGVIGAIEDIITMVVAGTKRYSLEVGHNWTQ